MIQGQKSTTYINKNEPIIGIHIPNKTKKILNMKMIPTSFLKNQASVINILKFFEDLNKATVTTIKGTNYFTFSEY